MFVPATLVHTDKGESPVEAVKKPAARSGKSALIEPFSFFRWNAFGIRHSENRSSSHTMDADMDSIPSCLNLNDDQF